MEKIDRENIDMWKYLCENIVRGLDGAHTSELALKHDKNKVTSVCVINFRFC